MPEERFHRRRQFLQSTKLSDSQSFHLIGAEYLLLANPMVFDVIPNLLGRIEFRRIRGQCVDFQLALKRIDAFLNDLGAVCRMSIPNQKNRRFPTMHKSLEGK